MELSYYNIKPPKNPSPYYDSVYALYKLVQVSQNYWFSKDAKKTNELLIFIHTKLFRMIFEAEQRDLRLKPTFTSEDLDKCFRTPAHYTGDIDWKPLKKDAERLYRDILILDLIILLI